MYDWIDLVLLPKRPLEYRSGGVTHAIPRYRLAIPSLLVGPAALGKKRDQVFEAWVDTGAPLTAFPFLVWSAKSFHKWITWFDAVGPNLRKAPPGAKDQSRRYALTLVGQTWTYRLGSVPLTIYDRKMGIEFPEQTVVAQFLDPSTQGQEPPFNCLVGIERSVLTGHRLLRKPDSSRTNNQLWQMCQFAG